MNLLRSTLLLTTLLAGAARADEIHAAVASNFLGPARVLATVFEESTGHRVVVAAGSTGKHVAQILNGAPFDVFLAADAAGPARLETSGAAIRGTRFTYAVGKLVLWGMDPDPADVEGALREGEYRHLAMANPDLAPYGRAALQVLENLGLWPRIKEKTVRGENAGQTLQFVRSGNAEFGFVAASQVLDLAGPRWDVPADLYEPIEQQAVLLRENAAARAFMSFLRAEEARAVIRSSGYGTP